MLTFFSFVESIRISRNFTDLEKNPRQGGLSVKFISYMKFISGA